MNEMSSLASTLQGILEEPHQGVVGLVDELLELCLEQRLEIHWQADRCLIRSAAGGSEEVLERPVRKSVFRAILARLAALCNERNPNSVSPYGGQGELSVAADGRLNFRVSFANTPDEQRLELIPVSRVV